VTMTRMWLGAVTLLALVGCGGGGGGRARVETDWVQDYPHTLPAGYADCVEGPYSIPDGAEIVFDVTDTYQDAMDVSVVPAGAPCDGSTGYGVLSSANWAGTGSNTTQTLPAGDYSLAVNCNNLIDDCAFTVTTFGYLY